MKIGITRLSGNITDKSDLRIKCKTLITWKETKMKYKVGFIGCGNMASAIIGGLISKSGISPMEIIASDASEEAT